jgi:iron(III) transport system substrate-binding protein
MLLLLAALACSEGEPATPAPAPDAAPPAAEAPVVTIYSGRGESLVGPLLDRITAETGVKVEVQYGKTAELVTRMITEGAESPADLVFAQDSGHLGALAARDLLAPLPESVTSQVDPRFRHKEGKWVGTSGRLRVLVYDTSKVKAEDMPRRLEELADPKWKGKLGWAPGNGSFQAHVSALRHTWGDEKTKAWLASMNELEPTRYPKNSPQVEAAAKGEIAIGWVNHYYLHRYDGESTTAANWSFPEAGDPGNVLMLAGVGVRKGSPDAAAAEKVAAWLVSEPAQQYFATETFEYPTRPGVATHPDVPALAPDTLATIEQDWLADVGPTRTMLQDLGLQ